jgi:hypothetical protein
MALPASVSNCSVLMLRVRRPFLHHRRSAAVTTMSTLWLPHAE